MSKKKAHASFSFNKHYFNDAYLMPSSPQTDDEHHPDNNRYSTIQDEQVEH